MRTPAGGLKAESAQTKTGCRASNHWAESKNIFKITVPKTNSLRLSRLELPKGAR